MSVVAGYTVPGTSDTYHFAAVKGAPEVIKSMLESVPPEYDQTYLSITRQGARVLALGFRELGKLTHQQASDFTREDCEKGFQVGLLAQIRSEYYLSGRFLLASARKAS